MQSLGDANLPDIGWRQDRRATHLRDLGVKSVSDVDRANAHAERRMPNDRQAPFQMSNNPDEQVVGLTRRP